MSVELRNIPIKIHLINFVLQDFYILKDGKSKWRVALLVACIDSTWANTMLQILEDSMARLRLELFLNGDDVYVDNDMKNDIFNMPHKIERSFKKYLQLAIDLPRDLLNETMPLQTTEFLKLKLNEYKNSYKKCANFNNANINITNMEIPNIYMDKYAKLKLYQETNIFYDTLPFLIDSLLRNAKTKSIYKSVRRIKNVSSLLDALTEKKRRANTENMVTLIENLMALDAGQNLQNNTLKNIDEFIVSLNKKLIEMYQRGSLKKFPYNMNFKDKRLQKTNIIVMYGPFIANKIKNIKK